MKSKAPCISEVSSPTDTSNFDIDDTDLRSADVLRQRPIYSALSIFLFLVLHTPRAGKIASLATPLLSLFPDATVTL